VVPQSEARGLAHPGDVTAHAGRVIRLVPGVERAVRDGVVAHRPSAGLFSVADRAGRAALVDVFGEGQVEAFARPELEDQQGRGAGKPGVKAQKPRHLTALFSGGDDERRRRRARGDGLGEGAVVVVHRGEGDAIHVVERRDLLGGRHRRGHGDKVQAIFEARLELHHLGDRRLAVAAGGRVVEEVRRPRDHRLEARGQDDRRGLRRREDRRGVRRRGAELPAPGVHRRFAPSEQERGEGQQEPAKVEPGRGVHPPEPNLAQPPAVAQSGRRPREPSTSPPVERTINRTRAAQKTTPHSLGR
jgi:hypothetical protein